MMDSPRVKSFTSPKFYSQASVISIAAGRKKNRLGRFWLAGDLALDLFPEFQGTGNLRKNFWCPSCASDDDGSVAQEPSNDGLLDGNTFDSWQEKLDGAAIG
jgi:hypothetical protein